VGPRANDNLLHIVLGRAPAVGFRVSATARLIAAQSRPSRAAKDRSKENHREEQRVSPTRELKLTSTPATRAPGPRPEVEPQKPAHVPPVKIPDSLDAAPKYDYSKPGHPLIEPTTPKASSPTTPQVPPHAVSPRPIGHSTSNSVRHGDISLNQKTNISVQTRGDAGAAARAIAWMQNTVNADLVRNMRGAAR
jgi:hypothetical protein